jgi:dihydrofolate reductase
MAKLSYLNITSLDGYFEDDDGKFDWARPSDEVHAYVNDVVRSAGTFLYGRRMYETMAVWETDATLSEHPGVAGDFARIWRAADKVVYSKTLGSVWTSRTRIERDFDPDVVRQMKDSEARDLMIAGAELAAQAFRAGLVDECHLYLAPVIVGSGKPALPSGIRRNLALDDVHTFASGFVQLRYRVLTT